MPDDNAQNGWFKKYIDKVMSELERLDSDVKGKMNKVKPAAIIGGVAALLVLSGLVVATHRDGVLTREHNTKYMISAEAGKTREQFKEYCTKDEFHGVAMKQKGVETDLGHIKNDIKDLKSNSEEVLKAIRRMGRENNKGKKGNSED